MLFNLRKKYFIILAFLIFLLFLMSGCNFYTSTDIPTKGALSEEKKDIKTITITAVGDIMVHMPQAKSAIKPDGSYDFTPHFEEVREYIKDSDIAICNLETTISTPVKGYTGYPRFRSPEEIIPAIKYTGFNVVITANNHSLDNLEFGVVNTLNALDKYGLFHAGTYRNEEESKKILIIDKKGIKVAILAYTFGTNGMEVHIDRGKLKYMVNYIEEEKILKDINRAKEEGADIVILYLHWGMEYARTVDEERKTLTDKLFRAGADIILGTHPHVIQPMEKKKITTDEGEEKEVFVAYSLGNFISNQRDRYQDSGVIVNITITKKNDKTSITEVSYVPTWVRVFKKEGKTQYRILPVGKFLNCEELSSTELERIREVWQETTDIVGSDGIKIKD
ncbi:CapA family protein [Thermoanaerobacter brockii subsp. lactiethylicus]|jgi:poly-gamma-glutamate synthesis protein (capsule biosynthesis protein)|uniref:CapA family protein n=1 Tax=Thermoanaerobacter sp. (strain X514) TaxID=399726 RepID=UPI0000E1DE73|nr:CapA family protein [Thermoanaerobacter sp. X514]ABY93150.1 Putative enzyme of poly-gamma-glutamate biosynthesis (capsule formation)-like protein [Thermoanaerobacter sp. X514]KUJ90654.1 MAG: capsule synthesis protein CapA [Thermoanaerobacter thermocopriae]